MSDSGASAIYFECSKQKAAIFAFLAPRCLDVLLFFLPQARLFVIIRDIKHSVIYIPVSVVFICLHPSSFMSIIQAAGENKSSFSHLKADWTQIQYPRECLVLL